MSNTAIPMATEAKAWIEDAVTAVRDHFNDYPVTTDGTEEWFTTLEDAGYAVARAQIIDHDTSARALVAMVESLPDWKGPDSDGLIGSSRRGHEGIEINQVERRLVGRGFQVDDNVVR